MKSSKKNFAKLATALLAAGVLTSGPAFAVRGTPNPPLKIPPGTFCSGHLKLCTAAKVVCGRC